MAKPKATPTPCPDCHQDPVEPLYSLKLGELWRGFRAEHISFWFLSVYFFFEYVRPQSIVPAIDILPWAQLAAIGAAISWLLNPNRSVNISGSLLLVIIFNALMLASIPDAYFPAWAKHDLLQCYIWLVVFFLTTQIVDTRRRLFILLLVILLASFKLTFFGARTWAARGFSFADWGMMGPPGFFQNSGEYAIQCLIFTVLVYYFALALRPHIGKWMYRFLLFAMITGVMSVIASSSRGAQLALLCAVVYLIFADRIRLRAVLGAILIAGTVFLMLPEEQKARFEAAGDDFTSQQRLKYYQRGWEMMVEHPWNGIGYRNFQPYFTRHYPDDLLGRFAESGAQLPHNILIQVGADLGVPALIVFLLLCYGGLRMSARLRKQEVEGVHCVDALLARGLAAGLVGAFVAGQFVSVLYYPFIWVQLALITCLYRISYRETIHAGMRRHARRSKAARA